MHASKLSSKSVNANICAVHGNKVILLDNYTRSDVPLLFKCKSCKNTWYTTYAHVVYHKTGCPKCKKSGAPTVSKTEVIKRIKNIHGMSLTMVGAYTKATAKTKFYCNSCHHTWLAKPAHIYLNGNGCPKCEHKAHSLRKTMPEATVLQAIKNIHNGTVVLISDYVSMSTRSKFKCVTCNNTWHTKIASVVNKKTGCQVCFFNNNPGVKRKHIKIKNKTFVVQGHESYALKQLVLEGYKVTDIVFGKDVPRVNYVLNDKTHKYYPDFYISKIKTIVEVKSIYTLMKDVNKLKESKAKRKATIKNGYNYRLMLYNRYGQPLTMPNKWYKMCRASLLAHLQTLEIYSNS